MEAPEINVRIEQDLRPGLLKLTEPGMSAFFTSPHLWCCFVSRVGGDVAFTIRTDSQEEFHPKTLDDAVKVLAQELRLPSISLTPCRGHEFVFLTDLGTLREVYRDAKGDWHIADGSSVVDIDTGYRFGRFLGPKFWTLAEVQIYLGINAEDLIKLAIPS